MNELKSIMELNQSFKKIHNYGYIKSELKSCGAAGNIFELLIGKKPDSKSLPDYKNVEIKTQISTSTYPIAFISIIPITKNKNTNEMLINFLNLCGHNGVKDKENKFFCDKIFINEIKYHYNYYIKSYINLTSKEVVIEFISYDLTLIERMTWPFEYLHNKFENKLKFLAIISVKKKIFHKNTYYKYQKIQFYKLMNKEKMIDALINKKMYISFNLRLQKIDNNIKVRYHGISFVINKNDINCLYEEINLPN